MKHLSAFVSLIATLALLLSVSGDMYSQTVQYGINANGTNLEVKIKSGVNYTSNNLLTDADFTIRWLTAYGVSLGTATSSYAIAKGGPQYTLDGYTYQKFYHTGAITPITLPIGTELLLLSVPVIQSGQGVGTFDLPPANFVPGFPPFVQIDLVSVLNPTAPYYAPSTEFPLPVELTSFTIAIDKLGALLSWKTATEINNAAFDIERALVPIAPAKKEWVKVGHVDGSGTSNAPKQYTFRNTDIQTGTYVFRLKQIDRDGAWSYSKEIEAEIAAPKEFALSQNYPNPFNPSTMINFSLAEKSRVTITVFDIVGREVTSLIDQDVDAGYYKLAFNGQGFSSGVYLYRITAKYGAGQFVQTKRLMLMK